ncbi:histidinol phosphatase [Mesobacillus campisalis]|uniref:Histidinol-phosphatase n=1 Tax=Mesobacillus campisalis TaxID=1408103 RepID=A0A0M2T0Q9_9BACI|nr:histidinol phosphate phosphatase domain-containing protein [Mesobacillus campisalis]KKK40013.1 histidinol phosphatase [Mesobacillus campisalis]
MKVDYHVHLEEGPYSLKWADRTNQSLDYFHPYSEPRHSYQWLQASMDRLSKRMKLGAYDESWVDLYLIEAKRKGLKEVGIVDHLYRFEESRFYFEKYMDVSDSDIGRKQRVWLDQVMTQQMDSFVEAVEKAKPRWAEQGVTLRMGIEADYFPGCESELEQLLEKYDWDYVIGSVHFVDGWGFDNPDTKYHYDNLDLRLAYQRFFTIVESAIRSELFDFVAHLDNFKVFNYRPDEKELLNHYHEIGKALAETDTATEINAGLYYRYPVKEMCPSPALLDILLEHGVHFTLSSDSHFPEDIGSYVDQNKHTLLEKGIKNVATFEKRNRIRKPIGEPALK